MTESTNTLPFPTSGLSFTSSTIQAPEEIETPQPHIPLKERIVAALKAAGYNQRRCSVSGRSVYYKVKINDITISLKAVKAAVSHLDTWSMDMSDYYSGESVDVSYSDKASEEIAGKYHDLIQTAIHYVESGSNCFPLPYGLFLGKYAANDWRLWHVSDLSVDFHMWEPGIGRIAQKMHELEFAQRGDDPRLP